MHSLKLRGLAILLGLTMTIMGCSGDSPTSPTQLPMEAQQAVSSPEPASPPATADPLPPAPGASAGTPQFTLSGPTSPGNCMDAGTTPLEWILNVSDAGPSRLHFVALAHQDETPGCGATTKNPRARMITSGVEDYRPHTSGQTIFGFDPKMYDCGRVQVDVSIFDETGKETLIIALVLNYGKQCVLPPPPPPQLVCTPSVQTVAVGNIASFTASGGTGEYAWLAPTGTPEEESAASRFTTSYREAGEKTVTVRSGQQTATCRVSVTAPPPPPPPPPPAVCTASVTMSWEPLHTPNPAVKYRVNVTPAETESRNATVTLALDNSSSQTSLTEINQDMYYVFFPDTQPHVLRATAEYTHSNGAVCRAEGSITIPATPPPPPPVCTPLFSGSGFVKEVVSVNDLNFENRSTTRYVEVYASYRVQNYPSATAIGVYVKSGGREKIVKARIISAPCDGAVVVGEFSLSGSDDWMLPSNGAMYFLYLYNGSTEVGTVVPTPINSVALPLQN